MLHRLILLLFFNFSLTLIDIMDIINTYFINIQYNKIEK